MAALRAVAVAVAVAAVVAAAVVVVALVKLQMSASMIVVQVLALLLLVVGVVAAVVDPRVQAPSPVLVRNSTTVKGLMTTNCATGTQSSRLRWDWPA